MGNPFVHLNLSCDDPEAAKKFYKAIFDWKFQDFPQMGWSGINVGTGVGGGLGKKQDPGSPTSWTAYVDVDDVKKTVAKAQKAGATILVPFMEVPGMGYLAVFNDPQGATVGIWQAIKSAAPPPAAEPAAAAQKAPAKEPAAAKAPAAKEPAAAQKAPAKAKAPAAKPAAPAAKPAAPAAKPAAKAPAKAPPPPTKAAAKAPPPPTKAAAKAPPPPTKAAAKKPAKK